MSPSVGCIFLVEVVWNDEVFVVSVFRQKRCYAESNGLERHMEIKKTGKGRGGASPVGNCRQS